MRTSERRPGGYGHPVTSKGVSGKVKCNVDTVLIAVSLLLLIACAKERG